MGGWGDSVSGSRVSGRSIGGSSIVLKIGQDNNGKWVWSAYHNNNFKKEPLFGHL